MIETDKYESMRQLFLDFIDSASDEVDEEAWKDKLTMLDDLLAEVKRMYHEYNVLDAAMNVREDERDEAFNKVEDLEEEVKQLRYVLEGIERMIPDNHEEVSPILSDILYECQRVLPQFKWYGENAPDCCVCGSDKSLAEVKRLREAIEYAIVHAENHDVIRVLDEVMKND